MNIVKLSSVKKSRNTTDFSDRDAMIHNIIANEIGNNVEIAGGSGVIKSIANNSKVMGYPAKNIREFLKENK